MKNLQYRLHEKRLVTCSSDIKEEGIFTPIFPVNHPEYAMYLDSIKGTWYEEPLNEDDIFTDLRGDEYPEFVALDRYPQCIVQVFTPEYPKEKHLHWLKLKQFGLGQLE